MRTERQPADYAYRARFPALREHAAAEGGMIYLAEDAAGWYIVADEGTLGDLLDDDSDLVTIHAFDTAAERDQWLTARGWRAADDS